MSNVDSEIVDRQKIERIWYAGYSPYQTESEILSDIELINFKKVQKSFFTFIHLIEKPGTRIINSLRRRVRFLINHPAGRTMGLMNVYAKPAMFNYLNYVSILVAKDIGEKKPFPYLVNSIIRSVEHQNHLQTIGYPALDESAHCIGYAADLEQFWYQKNRPDVHLALTKILENHRQSQIINLMNYGRFWHVCLNPLYIDKFTQLNLEKLCAEL